MITGGNDKQLRVWRSDNAAPARAIAGFGGEIFRLEMLPDNRVFSVSADKIARLHNANDGAALKTYTGHKDWVYSLNYHAATNRLVTGSYDGEVRIWNVDDQQTLKSWTAAPGLVTPQ